MDMRSSLLLFALLALVSLGAVSPWSGPHFDRRTVLATAIVGSIDLADQQTSDESSSSSSANADSKLSLSPEEEQLRQELLQKMKERRQLMEASRSSNNRQSYLDLSRQRAALYNTTSKAVSCPPNIPCL